MVAILEARLAVVTDVVEDVLGLVEAARVGHRQHGLDEGLAIDLVDPPAGPRLGTGPVAEWQFAVRRAEEDLGEPLDALGEGQLVHLGDVGVELLLGQLRDRSGGDEGGGDCG